MLTPASKRHALAGMNVADLYLDACCFIYLVEGAPNWQHPVQRRLKALPKDARVVSSQLSRLECRSKHLRDSNLELLAGYDALFSADRVVLLDIDATIVDRATVLRAKHNLKSPDALHLASAIVAGATAFLTGDASLARCTDVDVEVLASDDYSASE
jgi:predicted nucleic acid-binding protein